MRIHDWKKPYPRPRGRRPWTSPSTDCPSHVTGVPDVRPAPLSSSRRRIDLRGEAHLQFTWRHDVKDVVKNFLPVDGMALLNEGKVPEAVASFEENMKLAPSGQFAAQAKGMLAQLKPPVR